MPQSALHRFARYSLCGCCVTWYIAVGVTAHAQSFQGLGDLAGGVAATYPLSIGDPTFLSLGKGVSPDGNIVVGSSISGGAPPGPGNVEAFKWAAGSGIVGIGVHPTASFYSDSLGVTDGGLAVGFGDRQGSTGRGEVMRWSSPAGASAPVALPLDATTRQNHSSFTGNNPVDGSGNRIAGYINEAPVVNSTEASVWVGGQLRKLGWLAPGPMSPPSTTPRDDPFSDGHDDFSFALGINTPGTHIVGSSSSGTWGELADEADSAFTLPQAVLWHDPRGTWQSPPAAVSLGQVGGLAFGGLHSRAHDISNNGQIVVGAGCTTDDCFDETLDTKPLPDKSAFTGTTVAFVGTVGNPNLVSLGTLPLSDPDAVPESQALTISGNGSTVIGWSRTTLATLIPDGNQSNPTATQPIPITGHEAFIWDPILTGGVMRKLSTYLIEEQGLGAQLAGWTLKEANGISDDGRVIVGTGINPNGNYEAFRAVILRATAHTGDYNNDGKVNAADYTIWRKTRGQVVPRGTGADGNQNAMIDSGDYNHWRARFGTATFGSASTAILVAEPHCRITVIVATCCISCAGARCRRSRARIASSSRSRRARLCSTQAAFAPVVRFGAFFISSGAITRNWEG